MNHERRLSDVESARLATFITAAQAAAADWIGEELFSTKEFAALFAEQNDDRLIASLPLFPGDKSDASSNPPRLIVSMTQDVAARFAKRVFVEVGMPSYPNLLGDCVAEFANLVAGRAKALTIGTPEHFLLGTPTLDSVPKGECLFAVLAGELGELAIAVDEGPRAKVSPA